jgi:uncharacterized protein (DUF2235 family)
MTDLPLAPTQTRAAAKRLALFLDGTWNTKEENTNVWRLKCLCAPQAPDGMEQQIYYSQGLGTERGTHFFGGGFGAGLDAEVIKAYEWLIDRHNPGDQIFIFGFSRGAYTARSLSGFVAKCGLLQAGAPLGVRQLYDRYRQGAQARTVWEMDADVTATEFMSLALEDQWMMKYSKRAPVKLVGVWDTVGALGLPVFHIPGVSRSTFGFLHTGLRLSIENGVHALAIDEHRETFAPTLWTKTIRQGQPNAAPRPLTSVEQRWFVGAHANVGGGYASDLLPQTPLRWMMSRASRLGLSFREEIQLDDDGAASPVTDSFAPFLGGFYKVLKLGRPFYRAIGQAPSAGGGTTTSTVNETIDGSVFERWRRAAYRPKNLVQWAQSYGVDPAQLHGSVLAHDPRVKAAD